MSNAYQVVRDFEKALCDYTGARFAVTVTSCTMALLLAVKWCLTQPMPRNAFRYRATLLFDRETKVVDGVYTSGEPIVQVSIPKRTYVSVPASIIHAGGRPVFRDEDWLGMYQLRPCPIWDSARWFTSGMYGPQVNEYRGIKFMSDLRGHMACVSFHASKTLGDTQGGAILHDNPEADAWFRRMRFDGRTEGVAPKDDSFREVGYHCYMSPDVAARLLFKLSVLPRHNDPLPNDDYPDLSLHEAFR